MYPPIEELKLKLKFPVSSMSLMMVSVVTFPSSLTKKSCSITEAETVRREGSLRRSFPNLVGWLGYWVRQYPNRSEGAGMQRKRGEGGGPLIYQLIEVDLRSQ